MSEKIFVRNYMLAKWGINFVLDGSSLLTFTRNYKVKFFVVLSI